MGRDFEVTEDGLLACPFLRYGTASRRRLLQFIEQGVNPTGIAVRQFVTLDGFNSVTSSGGLTRYRYLYAKLARSMNCRKISHSHHVSSAGSDDGKTTSVALARLLRRARLKTRSRPAFCPMSSNLQNNTSIILCISFRSIFPYSSVT